MSELDACDNFWFLLVFMSNVPQCGAQRFKDGEISWVYRWVTFFSSDSSGLRRPKNVKFGTKVASSMKMMHTLRFLEKVNCGKIWENTKNRPDNANFPKTLTWWHHIYAETDSPYATSDSAEHRGPCDYSHFTCLVSC